MRGGIQPLGKLGKRDEPCGVQNGFLTVMSFAGFEDTPTWGVSSPNSADIVKDAMRKEQLLRYVSLR